MPLLAIGCENRHTAEVGAAVDHCSKAGGAGRQAAARHTRPEHRSGRPTSHMYSRVAGERSATSSLQSSKPAPISWAMSRMAGMLMTFSAAALNTFCAACQYRGQADMGLCAEHGAAAAGADRHCSCLQPPFPQPACRACSFSADWACAQPRCLCLLSYALHTAARFMLGSTHLLAGQVPIPLSGVLRMSSRAGMPFLCLPATAQSTCLALYVPCKSWCIRDLTEVEPQPSPSTSPPSSASVCRTGRVQLPGKVDAGADLEGRHECRQDAPGIWQ